MREYACKEYLSMVRDGCSMMVYEDIGDVKVSDDKDEDDESTIFDATVVAVPQLDSYQSCLVRPGWNLQILR